MNFTPGPCLRAWNRSADHLTLLAIFLVSLVAFWTTIEALIALARAADHQSHILVIPFISAFLIWSSRSNIILRPRHLSRLTILTATAGALILGAISRFLPLPAAALLLCSFWIAAFTLGYGMNACRIARFPLLLLLLIIPLPEYVFNTFIRGLQYASAEVVSAIFYVLHVPATRDGLTFSFPDGSISIEPQCSGIRSSIAFLITALIVAHLTLKSSWRKALLVASVVPMVVVKNSIRIATLSVLGFSVDPGFLSGPLHRDGGIVFFVLALVIWAPIVHLLQLSERGRNTQGTQFAR